jgi:hypothetical protein
MDDQRLEAAKLCTNETTLMHRKSGLFFSTW